MRPAVLGALGALALVGALMGPPSSSTPESSPGARLRGGCFGSSPNLPGATQGDDVLVGRLGRDVIKAKAGDDFAAGLSSPDRICGGKGNDTLNGGDGYDRLNGGPGYDTCREGERVKRCEAYQ